MKILYKKSRHNFFLIFGIGFLIFSILAISFNEKSFFNYVYALFSIASFIIFLFEKIKQYLTIKNGILTKNTIIPKKMLLDEIIHIKKFAGDYTLSSKHDKLVINIELIDKESIIKLETILNNLNL